MRYPANKQNITPFIGKYVIAYDMHMCQGAVGKLAKFTTFNDLELEGQTGKGFKRFRPLAFQYGERVNWSAGDCDHYFVHSAFFDQRVLYELIAPDGIRSGGRVPESELSESPLKYYDDQLSGLDSEKSIQVRFFSGGTGKDTNFMTLNGDCIDSIIDYLKALK